MRLANHASLAHKAPIRFVIGAFAIVYVREVLGTRLNLGLRQVYDAFPRCDDNYSYFNFTCVLPFFVACAAAYVEPSLLEDETSEYFQKVVWSVVHAHHPRFGEGTSYGTKNIANKFNLLVGTSVCAPNCGTHCG